MHKTGPKARLIWIVRRTGGGAKNIALFFSEAMIESESRGKQRTNGALAEVVLEKVFFFQ